MNTNQVKPALRPIVVLRMSGAIAPLALVFSSLLAMLIPVAAAAITQRTEPGASDVVLTAADAFDVLRNLNDRGEMVPSFFDQKRGYKGLDKKNCFGVKIGAARVVGESAGKDYGMYEMSQSLPMKVTAVQIGFLYSEADIAIGTATLSKGTYMVFLAPKS